MHAHTGSHVNQVDSEESYGPHRLHLVLDSCVYSDSVFFVSLYFLILWEMQR